MKLRLKVGTAENQPYGDGAGDGQRKRQANNSDRQFPPGAIFLHFVGLIEPVDHCPGTVKSGPQSSGTNGNKLQARPSSLVDLVHHFLQELRDLVGQYLARHLLERNPQVIAEMRNLRTEEEEKEQRRKYCQEVIEGHSPTLTKHFILPGFASSATK